MKDQEINPDIGGIGVLLGLFWPSVALAITLALGHKKTEASGAKELCLAHVANLLYLCVNLAKAMSKLNPKEYIVAYSSIDTVIASISMAFSDKDVIAARKILFIGVILQAVGFIIEGATINRLFRFPSACLSDITHPVLASSQAFAWTFWVVRVISSFAALPTLHRIAPRMHELENTSSQGPGVYDARIWLELPATLFTNYLIHVSVSLIEAIPTLMAFHSSISTSWTAFATEWGQSSALLVAMVASLHVTYNFIRLFSAKAVGNRVEICKSTLSSYVWPENWEVVISEFSCKAMILRSPFKKLDTTPPDELLLDNFLLLTYAQRQGSLDYQSRMKFWEELQLAFKINDAKSIKDCLNRGAPTEMMDAHQEFPIHMAARFGDIQILDKIYTEQDFGKLFSKNAVGDTPLMIAHSCNNVAVVKWILRRKPPTGQNWPTWPIKTEISRIMNDAILAERVDPGDLLDIITTSELVPNWGLSHRNLPTPFAYALLKNKTESAKFICPRLAHPIFSSFDAAKNLFSHERPDEILQYLLEDPFRFWTDHCLAPASAMIGFDINTICRILDKIGSIDSIKILIDTGLSLPSEFVNSIYQDLEDERIEYPLEFQQTWSRTEERRKISHKHDLKQIRTRLEKKGARSWSSFKIAVVNKTVTKVHRILKDGRAKGSCIAMLNNHLCYRYTCMSPLRLLLRIWQGEISDEIVIQTTQFMIRLGAPVLLPGSFHSSDKEYVYGSEYARSATGFSDTTPIAPFDSSVSLAEAYNIGYSSRNYSSETIIIMSPFLEAMIWGSRRVFLVLLKHVGMKDPQSALQDIGTHLGYMVFRSNRLRILESMEYLLSKGARIDGKESSPYLVKQIRLLDPQGNRAHMSRPEANARIFINDLAEAWEDYRNGLRLDPPTSEEHPRWQSIGDDKFSDDVEFTELEYMSREDDFEEETLTGWL